MNRIGAILLSIGLAACMASGDDDDDDDTADAAPPDGAPVFCESSLDGCRCSEASYAELSECSSTSVARPGTEGYCCETSFSCQCYEVACVQTGSIYCACGSAYVVDADGGTIVDSCTGTHCCMQMDDLCACSTLECDAGEEEVYSCSRFRVMGCDLSYEQETTVCL